MAGLADAAPLTGPALEVKSSDVQVKLPPVPDFAMAPASAGVFDPKELRVNGRAQLGKDIAVRGYVIWIYDCLTAIRAPGESKASAQQRIDDDPTVCERKKLYLGTTRTTPVDKGLWVVDVPRPPNKLELERLPKETLDTWPAVPKIKVGDYVTLTGTFAMESPHKERNSDGLLLFKSIAPARGGARASKAVAMPLHAGPPPAIPTAPPQRPVEPQARATSNTMLDAGNRELGLRQPKAAIALYESALKAWPDNTLALYGDGLANIELRGYFAAVTPLDHAVELAPDQPMYQMWAGIAAYEAALDAARVSQAAKLGVKPEQIEPDLANVDFTKARVHLELAVAMTPALWRAHYYLARIWRAQGAARDAAAAFGKAIESNPRESGPYIALGELYRKWDYTEPALTVALAGTQNVVSDASDVFFVLGMAYEDKGDEKKAIEAFTGALAAKATNFKAVFQRGQAYFRVKDYAKAKADLEAFMAAQGNTFEFARQQAGKMLADIPGKP